MIGIINYGLGNINAFENIYNKLHIPVKQLFNPDDFVGVDRLILPGVGAFDYAMQSFNGSGMRGLVEKMVFENMTPIIGICVGMQMLADSSDEGFLPGLGWIPGIIRKFDETKIPYKTRIPHMGWNDITVKNDSLLFSNFDVPSKFYFLHSYYFDNKEKNHEIASSSYGVEFTCAVKSSNIYGVQFHPEKSHSYGIKLLENFSKL
ncbi:MAG: imidazole glycerol phosphate synthase subunit HisH [Candidatus Staskawiczbacteria bacterium]|nr:imidazole glycerol phosphate synthase subunit HisH [Candidatus Staskawiczbacteria bacterium]